MEQKPATLNTVIIGCAITCIVLGGMVFATSKRLDQRHTVANMEQQEAIENLGKKITALENQTTELAARPTTDTATIDGLKGELGTAKTTIEELTTRIAELEKKPEPVAVPAPEAAPVAAAAGSSFADLRKEALAGNAYEAELDIWEKENPKAGKKIAKLRSNALDGIATEAELRKELRDAINKQTAAQEQFSDDGLVSRMNKRLNGLISIKKQATITPELKALRDNLDSASMDSLKAQVETLPEEQRKPFSTWLEKVNARNGVVGELNALGDAQ